MIVPHIHITHVLFECEVEIGSQVDFKESVFVILNLYMISLLLLKVCG